MAFREILERQVHAVPMPFTYRQASSDFESYLEDLMQISGLATRNQCYTMTRSVFIVFRSHVQPQVAMDFAQSLPAVLRSIFMEEWDLATPITPFGDRFGLNEEVRSIREAHNFSTPNAISDVALALRKAMLPEDYLRMIAQLPEEGQKYWATG